MRALRRRYGHSKSMTFGVVPPYKAFCKQIHSIDPDEGRPYLAPGQKYPMELTGADVRVAEKIGLSPAGQGDYGKPRYELSERELHTMLKTMSRMSSSNMRDEEVREAAGSLASSIMSTLGYEWI